MNIDIVKDSIHGERQRNRPWNIALGVIACLCTIVTDFALPTDERALAQEAIWFLCSVGFLFIAVRRTLRRRQLIAPFVLTLLVQASLMYLLWHLFPLQNSLLLIALWIPGILILGLVFAIFARIIDPHGPRPV